MAASGCASTGNNAPKTNKETAAVAVGGAVGSTLGAAGGVVVGAAAGALVSIGCGPAGIICLPVLITIGAAKGGEEGARLGGDWFRNALALESPKSASESSGPESSGQSIVMEIVLAPGFDVKASDEKLEALTALADPTRAATHTNIVEMGPIPASEFSPAGILSLDLRSVRPLDDGKRTASLVVNFERPTDWGEMSYMAEVHVACTSGALILNWWYSFDTLNTGGHLVRRSPSSQSVTNARPGPPLDAAIRTICSQELKG